MSYKDLYDHSIDDKFAFWKQQSEAIPWFTSPQTILTQNEKRFYRWFPDGVTNISYCCLDYQVECGRGNQAALVYDSPVAGKKETFT